jgi:hypothetical protein
VRRRRSWKRGSDSFVGLISAYLHSSTATICSSLCLFADMTGVPPHSKQPKTRLEVGTKKPARSLRGFALISPGTKSPGHASWTEEWVVLRLIWTAPQLRSGLACVPSLTWPVLFLKGILSHFDWYKKTGHVNLQGVAGSCPQFRTTRSQPSPRRSLQSASRAVPLGIRPPT